MRKILAIDVGGTFIKFAVMSGENVFNITEQNKFPTPKKNHENFLEGLAEIFNEHNDAEGIALSMPGLIDTAAGVCISSGALNFCNGHCLAEELRAICSVPVTVENDANCAALAEIKSGSLTDVNDAFVLVFGTAVGGALVRNREIYRGAHNCAGEVSYTLKNFNAIMDEKNFYANEISASSLQRMCAEILKLPTEEVSGEMIFGLLAEGDGEISDVFHKFARAVAVKIFNLQMIYDPERFALGGGISNQKIFIDAVKNKIDELCEDAPKFLPRPEVVACKYHNDANLYGALYRYLSGD